MRLILPFPVPTRIVAPTLSNVIKSLTIARVLKNQWLIAMVTPNIYSSDNFGAVVYPCRFDKKIGQMLLIKDKRIVLKALPTGRKIQTRFIEVGFSRGVQASPLSETADYPSKSIFSGDRKYFADFSVITGELENLLSCRR
ncbi:MAG TPA: hypothetical protein DCS23_01260 [Candidatus Yonathbacteria bacterium]|nr:hypothetical protein [Candidatus Yonathbacteria bacterium]